jgi:hypothetical protein
MDSTGQNDWDSLVNEMEEIRGRVQKTLDNDASGQSQKLEKSDTSGAQGQNFASMDEMLSGLGRDEIEADSGKGLAGGVAASSVSQATQSSIAPVIPLQTAPQTESVMSLAVVGALKIRLELNRQSQSVQIHLEDEHLKLELSDGTQFRIPLNKAA